jgi:hypothetical protein
VFLAGLLWLVFGVLRPRAARHFGEHVAASEEASLDEATAEDVRT